MDDHRPALSGVAWSVNCGQEMRADAAGAVYRCGCGRHAIAVPALDVTAWDLLADADGWQRHLAFTDAERSGILRARVVRVDVDTVAETAAIHRRPGWQADQTDVQVDNGC